MKYYLRHWYSIGLGVAAATAIVTAISWGSLSVLQILLIFNFIALLIHQFEEYGFPGGEPAIMNIVLQKSDIPDRYPLNQLSAMITNVPSAYLFYLLPVFFPNVIWLGLAPAIFGLGQFIVHGIATNVKLKSFYNPGLGAVVLLHFPIGIYYIYYVATNNLTGTWDWIFSVIYLLFFMAVIVNGLTYKVFPNRNSKYPFAPEEMKRFSIRKIKININRPTRT